MMKRNLLTVVALVLVFAVLLGGCDDYFSSIMEKLGYYGVTHSDDLEYTRPDFDALQQQLEVCCAQAQGSDDLDRLVGEIYSFYSLYNDCNTNYLLAQLRYSHDLRDLYWEEEYNWCSERVAQLDAANDQLLRTLAASPHRQALEGEDYFGPDFFEAYEGESMWTEDFTALMEQEDQLIGQYYALCQQANGVEYGSEEYYTAYTTPMTQVLVELVALRQQQAKLAGYDSYPEFAYEYYYMRGMSPDRAVAYMEQVGDTLVPLYRQMNESDVWDILYVPCYESQTYGYGKELAKAMGGVVQEAFDLLAEGELYDISYSEHKYNASFEVWLPSYGEPYLFMSPTGGQVDKLTFVHELGHFAADYVCSSSAAGMDVAEVHSQGLEYLSLCCMEPDPALVRYKLADSLCIYVEQSAYALFEHKLYGLEGDELTVENVQALFGQIGSDFGFDSWAWDTRDYITITHLYTSPMYLISYVVSNDVALQLYQLEQERPGQGVEVYIQGLHSAESDLSQFVQTYGLEDPLAEDRLDKVLRTFETILNG